MSKSTTKKRGAHSADTQEEKPGYTDKTDILYLTAELSISVNLQQTSSLTGRKQSNLTLTF